MKNIITLAGLNVDLSDLRVAGSALVEMMDSMTPFIKPTQGSVYPFIPLRRSPGR